MNTQRETTVESILQGLSGRDVALVSLALQRFLGCTCKYITSKGMSEKEWFQSMEHAVSAKERTARLAGIMFEASIAAAEEMVKESKA